MTATAVRTAIRANTWAEGPQTTRYHHYWHWLIINTLPDSVRHSGVGKEGKKSSQLGCQCASEGELAGHVRLETRAQSLTLLICPARTNPC